jgi:protease I
MRIALLLALIVAGCGNQMTGHAVYDTTSHDVLFIIAQQDFRDVELTTPRGILEDAGNVVKVASIEKSTATGMDGLNVEPDLAVADVSEDYDMYVIVGGTGSPQLADHPEVLRLIKEAEADGKLIGSICLGGTVLAKAGILEGRTATVFPTDEAIATLEDNGALYVNERVVESGKVVTADGPAAAKEFGETLLAKLERR